MNYGSLPELAYPKLMNCASVLLDAAVAAGMSDRTVFHHSHGNWSYRRLLETANRIAHVLVDDLGLRPGNRVLLRGPNHPMLAACWLATVKTGGIVVCVNPLLRARELSDVISQSKVNFALSDARVIEECEKALAAEVRRVPVMRFNLREIDSLESRMKTKPGEYKNHESSAVDPVIIAFTSGTTGKCKGTVHTHRDILAACDTFGRYVLEPEAADIFCGSPPLAFTYGLGGLLLFPLRFGASVLLLEQGTPMHLLHGIQHHRASVCFTAPTGYRAMLKHLSEFDISSLRKCVSAGEHLPLGTYEAWLKATGIKIIDGIGSTEMLHMFISSSGEEIRPGATGRVVPGYEARIVDGHGKEVPTGQIGRLAVRGPTGCRYLNNPAEQKKYVRDGWNLTGDSFRVDGDGYYWYQARTDDMIVSSGYNISAVEVENALLDHPKVSECAVVGAPDAERGHIVKAFVVLAEGVEGTEALVKEMQDFMKAEIAPYKYPRAIEFVPSLPRTANGKLRRFMLRQPEAGES